MSGSAAPRPSPRLLWLLVLVAVAVVGALGVIVIVVENEQADGQAALSGTTVNRETLGTSLPFDRVGGHVVIDVRFGDAAGRVPMILDSGAPVTLSEELAVLHGGDAVGQVTTAAIDGSVRQRGVVPVETVTIGDAVFHDIGAVAGFIGPDNPLGCISPNGLIGANLMRTAVWQIDYAGNLITIAPSIEGLDHIEGAIRLEFEPDSEASPSPVIEVSVGDRTLRFVVDTGSNGWLTISPSDAESAGMVVGPDAPSYSVEVAGSAGTHPAEVAYGAADLTLGDLMVPNTPIATLDALAEGQGNVGNAFLQNFAVTFDWAESALYLDPITDHIAPDVPEAAGLTWDGESIRVGSLVAGSDVADAGLVLGAPVTAVDGVDVTSATRDDFCDLMRSQKTGQSFDLRVGGDLPGDHRIDAMDGFFDSLPD